MKNLKALVVISFQRTTDYGIQMALSIQLVW